MLIDVLRVFVNKIVTTPPQLCRYYPLWDPYPSRFCSPHGFVLPQVALGKRPLHIKGGSSLTNTFSCAFLGDVGFHGMQDPPFWVTTLAFTFHAKIPMSLPW